MTTLPDFLLARIAEDEADARRVLDEYKSSPPSVYDVQQVPMLDAGEPDRVLAECAAKRAIVEWAETSSGEFHWGSVLAPLAAVYADHPEHREEWAL